MPNQCAMPGYTPTVPNKVTKLIRLEHKYFPCSVIQVSPVHLGVQETVSVNFPFFPPTEAKYSWSFLPSWHNYCILTQTLKMFDYWLCMEWLLSIDVLVQWRHTACVPSLKLIENCWQTVLDCVWTLNLSLDACCVWRVVGSLYARPDCSCGRVLPEKPSGRGSYNHRSAIFYYSIWIW